MPSCAFFNISQKSWGLLAPPGKRQDIPIIAIGVLLFNALFSANKSLIT